KKKINEIMQLDPNKRFDKLMRYLTQQMVTKTGNPRLGYSYLTLNWDRYRRLKLSKTKKNKYELSERPLSYFKNNPNGFSVSLAAAASYNAGTGSVDEALLNFGDTVDTNNIPLWIKHMIGANPRNVREPINYIRAFLEDKYNNTGKLSQEEQNIKNDLIAERYKRIYKVKDRLLENRKLVRKNGVTMYADYIRSDSFDHKLAALLARVIGSDYVDSFLRSHGMGKEWEKKIFSRTTPTFDMLASILSNENAPGYDDALSLQRYLDQKHFTASLAYLDERIEYFKQQEQTRSARIELTKQIAKEKELQKTMAFIKAWATRSAVGAASLAAAGAIAWIMRRRVKLGKKAVTPVMYKLPLKALGIFGLFAVRTVVAVVKLFVSTGSYIVSFLSRKKTPKRNRYKKNSSTRFWTIIIMPFIVFQFLSFFNADYTQAQTVNPVIGVTATQVSPLFDSLKNPVPKLTGQAKVVNWDAVRNFRRTYAYQSRQGGFKVISVDKIDGKNTIEVPAGGFAISREKDLYAPGFFGCVGTVWYHAKTKTAAIGHHYSEAPDTQAEVNQIVEFFKGIPLNEVVVTLVGASDNSNGVFTENLNSLLSKLREKQGININENKFDLFRPGEKAFYVDRETGNIYRVNQDAETSSIDTRDREEKHYFSIAKKVMYFTGLSAVVSIISTILTPGIAAAAAPGIISTGVGVGLILGLVLLGLSFIGIYAWVTLRRLQGSGQEQQNSETEVQNTKEQQDDGFEYSLRNREDWIEVLKNNGLQQANIGHVQRNVRAVEYFGEKENLTALEMEILKVSFWMHDLTKDTPIDKYKLRYLPEDTELSEIIQSLYERNLDDPKQAEQFLKEKSYEEDLIAKIKSVLNRNMKLAGTFRLLIHHLESAARAREILAELGYAENFIHKVESIIIRHMGPVMGKERMGFMEMTRTMNIGAIENGLVNSDLPLERNDKLMEYVDLLKRPFPVPITKLELIGRDIDLLDLAGDGVVKVVTFRQTLPDFFVDGRPEDIEASFDSAMQSAEDVSVNLGASTANNLINGMLARLENYKIHMQANGIWKLIALLDSSTKLDIFTKEYNGYMQENLLEYDLALKGERPLTPETLMKILQKRGEEQAATRLKRYTDDPMLERFWVFVLDFITRSKEKYGKVKQYNASQCNELLIAFDTLADYLPFVGNKEQIKRLSRIAIYMRDLGDFDESGDSALSAEGHRAKSKKIAEKFMRTFNEEFSGLEIEAVMYLIGKNQAAGKISDSFKQEAADDNRAYLLLSDFKVGRGWENVSGADRDANFIKKYMDKNFSHARIWIEDDLDLMMNVIWGGKVIAYGLDASADFPEQIPMMSRVFSLDELMLELMRKNEAVKRNPAPKTYIEQMSRNKENFVPFDNREMHQHGLAENMVGASI
ncbi:MAG: hypothetical protein L6416_06925, partial [Candidatus Omnitrophica bacterium]|nr:hypothetical protein [Candidatus Omnitrophota bacterium]